MRCVVRCCGNCDNYSPRLSFGEDGTPCDEEMGVCDYMGIIVCLGTPDCDSWKEGAPDD